MLKEHSRFFESLLFISDLTVIALSWLFSFYVRFHSGLIPLYKEMPSPSTYLLFLIPILVIWGVTLRMFGLYRSMRTSSQFSELVIIIKAGLLSVLLLTAVSFFVRSYELSRLVLVIFGFTNVAALVLARAVMRAALGQFRQRGYNMKQAVIVGTGAAALDMLRRLRAHPDTGINVVGLVSGKSGGDAGEVEGVKVLCDYDGTGDLIRKRNIDLVIIALGLEEHGRVVDVLESIGDEAVDIKIVPDVYELITLRGGVEDFDGIPVVSLRDSPLYGWDVVIKRGMDITASSAGIVAAAPLMALIAALIKLTSPGPVFYAQERVSAGGGTFSMLKFRSMRVDAEEGTGPVWASKDDPRRTWVGTFLRRTSLDELPQLFNVFVGKMSLVGPRPERPVFIKEFRDSIPKYMLRHKIKAGITGWAQVNGLRGNTDIKKRLDYDLYYIENWSLSFDLKIMLLTVWRGFFNKNAY
ncbi:MAG: undecaprenyl-phosphate glucose phosphotransferase [Thermodesulfobacteriota bacterium]